MSQASALLRVLVLSAALGLTACGSAREPGPAAAPRAIVGGSLDPGDPAVVAIGIRRIGCSDVLAVHCTGTLIAPRLILTAAHCVGDPRLGSHLEVLFGSDAVEPTARHLGVTAVHVHPDYHADGDVADLAVLVLESAAPVAPVPLGPDPLDGAAGQSVRLVGFGQTDPSGEAPRTKRFGTARIRELDGSSFIIIPGPALSCHGDSGGPILAEQRGREVLIGVTSIGDPGCASYGRNVRVDTFTQDFITPWIGRVATSLPPSTDSSRDGSADGADLCAAPCASDAECPPGLSCQLGPTEQGLAPRCLIPGLLAGALTDSCRADAECSERCVRVRPDGDAGSCRCYRACAEPPPESGCSTGRGPASSSSGLAWGLVSVATLLLTRRGRLFRRARPIRRLSPRIGFD